MKVDPTSSDNVKRVHELVQRTNQMNFSGNRYSREELETLIRNPTLDNFCLDATDKYGDYGIIGFCLVDRKVPRLIDMMFSCRIRAKHVEHGFLTFLLHYYASVGSDVFEADYLRTDRNQQGVIVKSGV